MIRNPADSVAACGKETVSDHARACAFPKRAMKFSDSQSYGVSRLLAVADQRFALAPLLRPGFGIDRQWSV